MIYIDWFSGIGGFHLGLEQAGFKFKKVYYSEIDKHAIKVYKRRFPNAEYIGAAKTISGQRIKADIITFGSPCQDFSIAGKRSGLSGNRSSLIQYPIEYIAKFRPDIFIWENVKGAFSSNSGADFWEIIKAFANIGGYRLEWQLLNTSWFLPQNRERIYLVGYNSERCSGKIFPIGETTNFTEFGKSEKQIASTLQNPGNACGNYKGMNLLRWQNKKDGIVEDNIAPSLRASGGTDIREKPVIVGTWRTHKDGEGFRKMSSNISPSLNARARQDGSQQPVITIRGGLQKNAAQFENKSTALTEAMGMGGGHTPILNNIRRLTPTECERLQGFPDGWTEDLRDTQRYKTLGNAVSVPVVKAVGKRILLKMIHAQDGRPENSTKRNPMRSASELCAN